MSTQALFDTFQGGSTSGTALVGHTSDSGHSWSEPDSGQPIPLSIDQNNTVTMMTSGGGNGLAVTSWTPPSTTYGIAAWIEWFISSGAGDYEAGVLLNGNFPGGTPGSCYNFQGYTGSGGEWMLGKDVAGAFTWVATTPHTFTGTSASPEKHFLYLTTAPDGSGGTILTAYVDGTQVLTYHDTSSPFTAAGKAGIRFTSPAATATTGVHISGVQTNAQVSSITGASSGQQGVASGNITVALEVPSIAGSSVALSSDSGGTFTPVSPLSIAGATATAPGGTAATFTYTPPGTASGIVHLTATTSNPTTTNANSPWPYNVTLTTANGYSFTGPPSGFIGDASTVFTITPNGNYTGTITITPSGCGLSAPIVRTWSGTSQAQTFTLPAPTAIGTVMLTATNSGSLTNPAALSYAVTVDPSLATSYTISGSPGGVVNASSTAFTVTPNGKFTGTITITPSGCGLSAPIALSWSATSQAQTFTLPPPQTPGTVVLTSTNSGTLTDPAVLHYLVTSAPTTWSFPSLARFAAGLSNVGYTVYAQDGSTYRARTTTGVVQLGTATTGTAPYFALISLPFSNYYVITWDDGQGNEADDLMAVDAVETTGLNQSQALSLILAATVNQVSGFVQGKASSPIFLGTDGITPRIAGTSDFTGNRNQVTLMPPS